MQLPKIAHYFFSTGLLLLALASIGDIHNHICLDGQEAFASVHFENFAGHPAHHGDKQHVDVDDELLVGLQASKSLDLDTPLLPDSDNLLFSFLSPRQQSYPQTVSLIYRRAPSALLPPLRAPPAFPA